MNRSFCLSQHDWNGVKTISRVQLGPKGGRRLRQITASCLSCLMSHSI